MLEDDSGIVSALVITRAKQEGAENDDCAFGSRAQHTLETTQTKSI